MPCCLWFYDASTHVVLHHICSEGFVEKDGLPLSFYAKYNSLTFSDKCQDHVPCEGNISEPHSLLVIAGNLIHFSYAAFRYQRDTERFFFSGDRVVFCRWNQIDNELNSEKEVDCRLDFIILLILIYFIFQFGWFRCATRPYEDCYLLRIFICTSTIIHQQFSLSQMPGKRSSCYSVIKQAVIHSIDSLSLDIRNGSNSFCSHFKAS
jgi:hypothetical protein